MVSLFGINFDVRSHINLVGRSHTRYYHPQQKNDVHRMSNTNTQTGPSSLDTEEFPDSSEEIRVAQSNLAREIIQLFVERGILHDHTEFRQLNILLLVPARKTLQVQTVRSLTNFSEFIWPGSGKGHKYAESVVLNTANLRKSRSSLNEKAKDIHFINKLVKDSKKGEYLHVVIRDEVHWGISEESLTVDLLNRIAEVKNTENFKATILVLLVSATPEVLTKSVVNFEVPMTDISSRYVVDMDHLIQQAPDRFRSPTYIGVLDLKYANDNRPEFLNQPMQCRSFQLAFEYVYCTRKILGLRHDGVFKDFQSLWAREVMRMRKLAIMRKVNRVLKKQSVDDDMGNTVDNEDNDELDAMLNAMALNDESSADDMIEYNSHITEWPPSCFAEHYGNLVNFDMHNMAQTNEIVSTMLQSAPDRKKMAIVRLSSTTAATALRERMKIAFKESRNRTSTACCEVVSFIGTEKIKEQLTEQSQHSIETKKKEEKKDQDDEVDEEEGTDFTIKDLKHVNVFLIVVAKVAFGDQVPSTCYSFDVRARYRSEIDDISDDETLKTSRATFVQDVGRCTGYKRPDYGVDNIPKIHIGFHDPSEYVQCPEASRDDLLLEEDGKMKVRHPENEGNSRVFSKLVEHTVLLKAQTQSGKTGTFLAFLALLRKKYCNYIDIDKLMNEDRHLSESEFVKLCKEVRKLANHDWSAFVAKMRNAEFFTYYHRQIQRHHRNSKSPHNPNYAILTSVLTKMEICATFHGRKTLLNVPVRIADCGCGMHGLIETIHQSLKEKLRFDNLRPIHVTGFDLCDEIVKLEERYTDVDVKLQFQAVVGDMSQDISSGGSQATAAAVAGSVEPSSLFDVVVYNCSLFENDCVRHFRWAYEHLTDHGLLVVVTIARLLPKNWENLFEKCGFVSIERKLKELAGTEEERDLSDYFDDLDKETITVGENYVLLTRVKSTSTNVSTAEFTMHPYTK